MKEEDFQVSIRQYNFMTDTHEIRMTYTDWSNGFKFGRIEIVPSELVSDPITLYPILTDMQHKIEEQIDGNT